MPLTELGAAGAVINTGIELKENEYIDVALHLKGAKGPVAENLFAQVASSGQDGLVLRWLHFDPGEEGRLDGVIATFAKSLGLEGAERELGSGRKSATRRIIRPKQNRPAEEGPESDASKRQQSAVMPFVDSAKKESRRIVKPRPAGTPASGSTILPGVSAPAADAPSGGAQPASRGRQSQRLEATTPDRPATIRAEPQPNRSGVPAGGDDSGMRQVVIEPTARYAKLRPSPDATPASGNQILSKDGKIDVGATLKSRSRTVRASELAARHDKVRVLNMSTIKDLIQAAVAEAVELLGGNISEDQKKQLLQQAEEGFKAQMDAFKAEKAGMEAQAKNLQDQLRRAQELLDKEKQRVVSADQFTMSAAGMEDLQQRFDRLVNRAIKVNGVNDALADELRAMVAHLLDSERERIAEQARQAQSAAIAMLEKKVGRLAASLDETEKERDKHMRRAAVLEATGGGIAGYMEAGLAEDDPAREKKLEMLKTVRDQNRAMREALQSAGITIEPRRRKPQPVAQTAQGADVAEGAAPADGTGTNAAAAADATAATANHASVAEVAPAGNAEEGSGTADDAYDGMVDPDDDVWQPGMSFSREVKGDNEHDGDDSGIKKISSFKDFEPPPLEGPAAATTADAEPDPYAGNPDDELWDGASAEATADEDGSDAVQKVSGYRNFEPPPLERQA